MAGRGCPFRCTFCDWGQATHSRVHELPGARVERELAWLAERKVPYLYLVDANFGIRRRDEDITRATGELARAHRGVHQRAQGAGRGVPQLTLGLVPRILRRNSAYREVTQCVVVIFLKWPVLRR